MKRIIVNQFSNKRKNIPYSLKEIRQYEQEIIENIKSNDIKFTYS